MALVNIPRDVKDEFHRYKMPALVAKVEGRGNGIKTVIVNMADIAKSLDRPPEYVTKFFGFELGALTTIDFAKDRYIVNGKHDQPKLAQALDEFIHRYILCKKCVRNPETKMLAKAGNIELHCKACGNRSPVDMRHKLASFILKNPAKDLPSQKDKKNDKDAKKPKSKDKDNAENGEEEDNGMGGDETLMVKTSSKKKKKKDDEDDEDGVEWFTDTSKEATEERRRQMLDNTSELAAKLLDAGTKDRKNPLDQLQKFLETNPTNEQLIAEAKRIKEIEKLDDEQLASLVFVAVFEKDILKHLKTRISVLKEITKTESARQGVLVGIEELCGVRDQSLLKSVPPILKSLYDEDILEEETLYHWYDEPSKGTVAQVKGAGKIFVDWLRNAEEESDEEEEEGEEEEAE